MPDKALLERTQENLTAARRAFVVGQMPTLTEVSEAEMDYCTALGGYLDQLDGEERQAVLRQELEARAEALLGGPKRRIATLATVGAFFVGWAATVKGLDAVSFIDQNEVAFDVTSSFSLGLLTQWTLAPELIKWQRARLRRYTQGSLLHRAEKRSLEDQLVSENYLLPQLKKRERTPARAKNAVVVGVTGLLFFTQTLLR